MICLYPDGRIIFCWRLELYVWHYYSSVVDGDSARDTTTKGVVDDGYFMFSFFLGTICDFDSTFSNR
jgi:hypothetical protein